MLVGEIAVPAKMPTTSLTSAYFSGTTRTTVPGRAPAIAGAAEAAGTGGSVAAPGETPTSRVCPGPGATCTFTGARVYNDTVVVVPTVETWPVVIGPPAGMTLGAFGAGVVPNSITVTWFVPSP